MELKQAKELVRGRLSDKRYEHTINVKKMAVKLAKHYGTDPEQAALAALLHDAAKELPKDEMRAIMQAYPQYAQGGEARPTPVWHGICAAILARTEWGVTDEAVLSAIACHTAGKAGMTQLGQDLVSGRYDQCRTGLARGGKAAQAGNEGFGRGHAGGAQADQRLCAVRGQAPRPREQGRLRGYLSAQRAE